MGIHYPYCIKHFLVYYSNLRFHYRGSIEVNKSKLNIGILSRDINGSMSLKQTWTLASLIHDYIMFMCIGMFLFNIEGPAHHHLIHSCSLIAFVPCNELYKFLPKSFIKVG